MVFTELNYHDTFETCLSRVENYGHEKREKICWFTLSRSIVTHCELCLDAHILSVVSTPNTTCLWICHYWEDDEQTTRLLLAHDSTLCQYGTFKPEWVAPCTRKLFFRIAIFVHVLPILSFLQSDIGASQATIARCLGIFLFNN